MSYKRVVLKLSGEALSQGGSLFGREKINEIARILVDIAQSGVQLGIVIGGGNLWRGRQGENTRMDDVTADQMGMLATVMNCLCMRDAIEQAGGTARVFSALDMPQVCDSFRADIARKALDNGEICLFAGGLGNPYFTTDTAVILRAVQVKADAVLLAKNIDGVYTKDPNKHADATLIKDISYQEAIAQGLKVMDHAAFALCAEKKLPFVRVFGLDAPENIQRVLSGDTTGTVLHP